MNTALRVESAGRFSSAEVLPRAKTKLINLVLVIAMVFSAFAIIYIKDLSRRAFIDYQSLQLAHDKLYEDWGKLLLEQSTWSTQARVQKIAKQRLNMSIPSPKEMVVLRLSKKANLGSI